MICYTVVEDVEEHKNMIQDSIVSFMMNNDKEFCMMFFNDNTDKLKEFIKNNTEDTIYIIDLEYPNGNGMDVAEYIRNECDDWISPIIICSSHTSMIHQVYKRRLQILDFVGKCYDIEKLLAENLEICLKIFSQQRYYRFSYANSEYSINYNKIDYIQRDGRKTIIVTSTGNYYQNISIKSIKDELPSYFVMSNKGTIINTNNIEEINWGTNCVKFKDGKRDFVVSKTHRKEIRKYVR